MVAKLENKATVNNCPCSDSKVDFLFTTKSLHGIINIEADDGVEK